MVTELVPLDGQASERPTDLLSMMGESQAMRAAAQGHTPASGMRYAEQASSDEPAPPDRPEALAVRPGRGG